MSGALHALVKIAKALDVSTDYLLGYKKTETNIEEGLNKTEESEDLVLFRKMKSLPKDKWKL